MMQLFERFTGHMLRYLFIIALLLSATLAAAAQTGGIKGKVRTNSGIGIANAEVSARKDGEVVRKAKTNSRGEFVLDGLRPGTYNIAFDADGYSTGVLYRVEVKQNSIKDLGDRLILNRDRGTQVIVRGIVFSTEGLSIAGAVVDLYVVGPNESLRKLGTTYTNQMGEFGFGAIDPTAKVRVKASYKGASASKDLDTSEPQVYRTSITLPVSREPKQSN